MRLGIGFRYWFDDGGGFTRWFIRIDRIGTERAVFGGPLRGMIAGLLRRALPFAFSLEARLLQLLLAAFFGGRFGFPLFFDQYRQAVDQAGQALFIALQHASLVMLGGEFAGQLFQQRGAAGIFFFQYSLLLALFLCDFFELATGVFDFGLVDFDFLQVDAQAFDQCCFSLGYVAHVTQLPVDAVRIVAGQEQLDPVFIAGDILFTQHLGQALLLRIDRPH